MCDLRFVTKVECLTRSLPLPVLYHEQIVPLPTVTSFFLMSAIRADVAMVAILQLILIVLSLLIPG